MKRNQTDTSCYVVEHPSEIFQITVNYFDQFKDESFSINEKSIQVKPFADLSNNKLLSRRNMKRINQLSSGNNVSSLYIDEPIISPKVSKKRNKSLRINSNNKGLIRFGNIEINKLNEPSKYKRYRDKNNKALKKHREKIVLEKKSIEKIWKENVEKNTSLKDRLNKLTAVIDTFKQLINLLNKNK